MRRLFVATSVLCAIGVAGCEDGPNDNYEAAGSQNNTADGGYSDDAGTSLDARYPGKSAQEICSADELAARWAKMVNEPIKPPRVYAGIDMAKTDLWEGITIEEAEHINCQSTNLGGNGDGTATSCWGDNCEVVFTYDTTTHIVVQMEMRLGYNGVVTAKSKDGAHTYEIGVGKISKDGAQFLIHWKDDKQARKDITELYNAAVATFTPTVAQSADCTTDANCLYLPDAGDGTGIFGLRPMSIYFIVPDPLNLPPEQSSKPTTIYNFYTKSEPYSKAPLTLKLDADGPIAQIKLGSKKDKNCDIKLRQKWSDFIANCVKVADADSDNQTNYNKLVGGHLHDLTTWVFSTGQFGGVNGVNLDYSTSNTDPFFFITDKDLPTNDDVATAFIFDTRASSTVTNDLADPTDPSSADLHGSGAVVYEYLKSVQNEINSFLPVTDRHKLGDPACFGPDSVKAKGCTGLEGYIIPGPEHPLATAQEKAANLWDPAFNLYDGSSLLRPGDPKAIICDDPTTYEGCDLGPLWDFSFQRVKQVMGKGDVFNLPAEIRDRRFFFQKFAVALVRYMKAVGVGKPLEDLSTIKIDQEALFFDNSFSNQFDKAEYVERDFMDAAHPYPIDFEYGTDVKTGNQRYTHFFGRLDREEKALYQAMAEDKAAVPGIQNNLQITNLAGSPLLASAFEEYKCASDFTYATTKGNCTASSPIPTDGAGKALKDLNGVKNKLSYYRGVWEPTVFHIGSQEITIDEQDLATLSAKVSIPNRANPYDSSSTTTPIKLRMDFVPKRPDIGFGLPISGTRDKWISTGQLEFFGITETILVDYLPVVDDKGVTHAKIVAIETHDFLGEVFLCKDPKTGDILSARMYSSGATILEWLDAHPGSRDACGIIVRNSPFNNYPDFITSLTNGVKLNMTQGTGFGRVDDVTIFDPALSGS
ncbi:MAG: hypothetical protein ACXVEE_25040 [Polyangiales bacterium]